MTDRPTASTINDAQLDQLYIDIDTARQHAAAIAAQRDRLRTRMNNLADRWDHTLPIDKPYARTLRNEISVAPFDPDGAMTVQEYTQHGQHLWAFRCWGTSTCDGWLGLGHHTQTSALLERERHVAEAHGEPGPETTGATGHVYLSSGCHPTHEHEHLPNGQTGHQYCESMTGLNGTKRPGECKHCGARCQCPNHQPGPADTHTEPPDQTKEQ